MRTPAGGALRGRRPGRPSRRRSAGPGARRRSATASCAGPGSRTSWRRDWRTRPPWWPAAARTSACAPSAAGSRACGPGRRPRAATTAWSGTRPPTAASPSSPRGQDARGRGRVGRRARLRPGPRRGPCPHCSRDLGFRITEPDSPARDGACPRAGPARTHGTRVLKGRCPPPPPPTARPRGPVSPAHRRPRGGVPAHTGPLSCWNRPWNLPLGRGRCTLALVLTGKNKIINSTGKFSFLGFYVSVHLFLFVSLSLSFSPFLLCCLLNSILLFCLFGGETGLGNGSLGNPWSFVLNFRTCSGQCIRWQVPSAGGRPWKNKAERLKLH